MDDSTRVTDRFTDLHQVGQGRNAVVFRAWDTQLSRAIVFKAAMPDELKLSRDELDAIDIDALELPEPHHLGAELFRERAKLALRYSIEREGILLAQVEHPNVITVLDVAELDDDRLAIVLPYLEGGALDERARPERWEDALELVLQIGRGLAAIHAAGLLHRDLKPSNVLFDRDGEPVIVDLGLACRIDDEAAMADWVGTLAYMAPEVVRRERRDVRDDLYALCVLAFETFYGDLPFATFPDRDAGRVQPIVREAGMSAAVHEVIVRGLAPDPDERWPDVDTLLRELEAARDRPAPRRRRPWASALAWTAAAASIGLALSVPDVRASACEGLSREVEVIWNDDVRVRLRDALGTRKAGDGLQDWVSRWLAVRGQECVVARVSGGALGPTPCSASLRDRFAATIHAFETPHSRGDLSFATVLAELPAPEHCLAHPDETDWGSGPAPLRNLDVEVEALIRMGDLEVARGRLDAYLAAATAIGSEHGIARVLAWHAELHRLDGELDDAEREFEAVYREAARLDLGALAGEAMLKLAAIAGARGDSALVDAYSLAALKDLTQHRPERIAELLQVRGLALGGEQGLGLLVQAVRLREEQLAAHPGSRELLSQARESYARGLLDVGRADAALEQLEVALAIHREEFGHGTWRVQGILRQQLLAHIELDNFFGADMARESILDIDADADNWSAFAEDVVWSARASRSLSEQYCSDVLERGRAHLVDHAPADVVARFDRALAELGGVAACTLHPTTPPP